MGLKSYVGQVGRGWGVLIALRCGWFGKVRVNARVVKYASEGLRYQSSLLVEKGCRLKAFPTPPPDPALVMSGQLILLRGH